MINYEGLCWTSRPLWKRWLEKWAKTEGCWAGPKNCLFGGWSAGFPRICNLPWSSCYLCSCVYPNLNGISLPFVMRLEVQTLFSLFNAGSKNAYSIGSPFRTVETVLCMAALCTVVIFALAVMTLYISGRAFLTRVSFPATATAFPYSLGVVWLLCVCLSITNLVPSIASVNITCACLLMILDWMTSMPLSLVAFSPTLSTSCCSLIASFWRIAFSLIQK